VDSPSPVRRTWPRAVLCAHLVLSPLVFLRLTGDSFEQPKAGLLVIAVIAVFAMALASRALRMSWSPGGVAARLGRPGLRAVGALVATGRDPLVAGVWLFVASAAVSTAVSTSPRTSLVGTPYSRAGLLTIAAYAGLFLVTRWLFPRPADAARLLLAPVVAAALVSAYAIVQALNLDPLVARLPAGELERPFSTMGNPNFLGAFEVAVLPLAAYFAHRSARDRRWLLTAVFLGTGVLCAIALALSLTRASWLAGIPATLVLLVGWWRAGARRSARVLVVMILGAALMLGGLGIGWERGQALVDALRARAAVLTVDNQRQKLWSTSLAVFLEAPVLGVGPDTFHFGYDRKRTAEDFVTAWNTTFFKAHNDVIQVMATQGLVGLAALAVVVTGLVRAAYRAWRRGSPEDRALLVALVASAVGFCLQLLLSFVVAGAGTLFVTVVALISTGAGGAAAGAPARPAARDGAWLGRGIIAAALLFLAICGVNSNRAEPLEPRESLAVLGLLAVLLVAVASAIQFRRGERGARLEPPTVPELLASPRPLTQRLVAAAAVTVIWAAAAGTAYLVVVRHYVASAFAENGFRATEMQEALERFERAVALDGGHDQHWALLGSAYELLAQRTTSGLERHIAWRRARQAFEEAVRLVPAESHHHIRLGRVLARAGGPDRVRAYASFDEGIRLNPANVYFYLTASSAALEMGSRFRARQYAARAVELYPEFGLALLQLGHIERLDGRLADAEALVRRAVEAPWSGAESAVRVNALEELAEIMITRGRPEEALALARQDAQAAPDEPGRHGLLVTLLERLGRTAEALEENRRLLQRHPEYEPARQAMQRLARFAALSASDRPPVEKRSPVADPGPRYDRRPSPDYPGALR
jgi:O-antigen ligase/tetratricopeptide (TPR) repeat protein